MKKNTLFQTSSQTVGPFFAYGLTAKQYEYDFPSLITGNLRKSKIAGIPISIIGKVFDGKGQSLNDAMIEIWHADPEGNYRDFDKKDFFGFGRQGTGSEKDNIFKFETYKPGKISKIQSPHINFTIFARGMLNHLFTRMYFPDEENQNDFLLEQINSSLHSKLICSKLGEFDYRFDIFLQGQKESVFLDL